MCKMLLSINPVHVDNILNGTKQFEYRKVQCRSNVDKIIIYSTYPIMKVVGEADVFEILVDEPNNIWEQTSSLSGITKEFYDLYFSQKSKAVAYRLGNVKTYRKPLDLSDIGIRTAPQSFAYINNWVIKIYALYQLKN